MRFLALKTIRLSFSHFEFHFGKASVSKFETDFGLRHSGFNCIIICYSIRFH